MAYQSTACTCGSITGRHRGRARRARIARVRRRQGRTPVAGATVREARAPRPLPERAANRAGVPLRRRATAASSPLLGHGDPRGRGRLRARARRFGGESILYYGAAAARATTCRRLRARTRAPRSAGIYASNALAQEKTGEFWVDGQSLRRAELPHRARLRARRMAMFIVQEPVGSRTASPARARRAGARCAKDPARALIVIDPRRSRDRRAVADHFLPGAARRGRVLPVRAARGAGRGGRRGPLVLGASARPAPRPLLDAIATLPIADYCARAGVAEADVRAAGEAHRARRKRLDPRGPRHPGAPHSTLNSYLEKLLYLLSGPFRRAPAA